LRPLLHYSEFLTPLSDVMDAKLTYSISVASNGSAALAMQNAITEKSNKVIMLDFVLGSMFLLLR
jgi:hypothetical protein